MWKRKAKMKNDSREDEEERGKKGEGESNIIFISMCSFYSSKYYEYQFLHNVPLRFSQTYISDLKFILSYDLKRNSSDFSQSS